MSHYRRMRVPGGTYFFTVRLQDRASDVLVQEIDRLRHATRRMITRYPTQIDAIVILPNTIHTIWTLPDGDCNYSDRWAMLKSQFSRGLVGPKERSASHKKHRNKGIWQRRFWEHCLQSQDDFDLHRTLILTAPVQHGLASSPSDWPYSSIHRDTYLDATGKQHPPQPTTDPVKQDQRPLGRAPCFRPLTPRPSLSRGA